MCERKDEQSGHFAEKRTVSNAAKKNKVASAMNRKESSEETGGGGGLKAIGESL